MGKAFTEEERLEIRKQIMQMAYKLFTQRGVKKVTIREITSQIGIAQGSFYSFFEDKNALLFAIMGEEHQRKIEHVLNLLPGSEEDPIDFIKEILLHNSKNIYNSEIFWEERKDILYILSRRSEKENAMINNRNKAALNQMLDYWKAHGKEVQVDAERLLGALHATSCLAMNQAYIGSEFKNIYLNTVQFLITQCVWVK